MTSIEVDPAAVLALAGLLSEVAGDVQWQATTTSGQAWALGPGDSARALAAVLGDFEHQRQLLGRELDDLARRLARAGRLYAEVDREVANWLAPGAGG